MISGLGRSITIQRATVTKNALFEDAKTFTNLLTTGCTLKQIVRQRGQQELVQDDRYSTIDDVLEATLNYGPITNSITTNDRAVIDGVAYDILTVSRPQFERKHIVLLLRRIL